MWPAIALLTILLGSTPIAAQSVDKPAPPAPAEPEPRDGFPEQTAELLAPFQGSWIAYQRGNESWSIEIDGQHFSGRTGPSWYKGTVWIRPDKDPAELDFLIEDCSCKYKGMPSQAIFKPVKDWFLMAAPAPEDSRPTDFKNQEITVELRRPGSKPKLDWNEHAW